MSRVSTATVTVAGAGPKSRAEVTKNVSEIEKYTGTPGTFTGNAEATTDKAVAQPTLWMRNPWQL